MKNKIDYKLLEHEKESMNENSTFLEQTMGILSILSKNDALTIFLISYDGIKSNRDAPVKIGLTKKQYYTRLKQLIDLGLITKHNEYYMQTAFGNVVYQKHVIGLSNSIKNSKYLQMIDVLNADSKFNDRDIMEFISKVESHASTDLYDSSAHHSTVASSFDDMVEKILEIVEIARKEILLVTRFQSDFIVNTILKKANTGVNVKILADAEMIKEYFTKEPSGIKSDRNKNEREKVVSNPFYPSKIDRRYTKVPFCFIVIDNKHIGLEITDAVDTEKFKMAVFNEDQVILSTLITMFDNLWQNAATEYVMENIK